MRLRPGMRGGLLVLAFHHQIAGDVAGRNLQCAGAGEEDMGVVLANAALGFQCLFRRRLGIAGARLVLHGLVDCLHQRVHLAELVVA